MWRTPRAWGDRAYYPDKNALLADMVGEMLGQERALFRHCLRSDALRITRERAWLLGSLGLFVAERS